MNLRSNKLILKVRRMRNEIPLLPQGEVHGGDGVLNTCFLLLTFASDIIKSPFHPSLNIMTNLYSNITPTSLFRRLYSIKIIYISKQPGIRDLFEHRRLEPGHYSRYRFLCP